MTRTTGNDDWQKALWRILTHPTFEVVAAIVVVAISTWIVVQAEVDLRNNPYPLPFHAVHK
ncbi:MAG TPA: hypothetical protein VEC19_14425 [Usitatibacter sp.]|nr:hypothetical protein [Usitatibacter sp.]